MSEPKRYFFFFFFLPAHVRWIVGEMRNVKGKQNIEETEQKKKKKKPTRKKMG